MPNKESLSKDIIHFLEFNGIAGQDLDAFLYFCEQRKLSHTDYNSILLFREHTAV